MNNTLFLLHLFVILAPFEIMLYDVIQFTNYVDYIFMISLNVYDLACFMVYIVNFLFFLTSMIGLLEHSLFVLGMENWR